MAQSPQSILRPEDFSQHYATFNGLRLHYVAEGTPGAPLIVLLHGFPEFWYSWRHQIKPLAEAGYYVVAVDQRGYNLSDKGGPYDVFTLSDDIAGFIQALGYSQAAAMIGHDWGGVVTWVFGARYPEMARKVAVCNVPHPYTLTRAIRERYWPQLAKSWYMAFFQLPWLPEQMLSTNNFQTLSESLVNDTSGMMSSEEIGYFKDAWRQPMALTAMISWYRALFQTRNLTQQRLIVKRPALLIWGDNDFALTTQTAEWSRDYIPGLQIKYIHGGSHWIQQEHPAEVNQYLLEFLRSE
jgi:pimeloyl-ACP methyl ester carboxylesterase